MGRLATQYPASVKSIEILCVWPDALAHMPDKHVFTSIYCNSHTHAQDPVLLLTESAFVVGIDNDSF